MLYEQAAAGFPAAQFNGKLKVLTAWHLRRLYPSQEASTRGYCPVAGG